MSSVTLPTASTALTLYEGTGPRGSSVTFQNHFSFGNGSSVPSLGNEGLNDDVSAYYMVSGGSGTSMDWDLFPACTGQQPSSRTPTTPIVGEVAAPVTTRPTETVNVVLNYASHQTWQKRLEESKILDRGADSLVVYQRLGLPVIDDRDYTLQITWGAEDPILWMRFAVANERGPKPVSGVVRVTAHEGGWRLEPEGGKGTRAVYRFYFDAAGYVPSWLGKGQAKDDVVDFFDRLKRELPKYR